MKQFKGIAGNIGLVRDEADGIAVGVAEVVVLISEAKYVIDEDFDVHEKVRDIETLRFHATSSGLKKLIESLTELRGYLDEFENSVTVRYVEAE